MRQVHLAAGQVDERAARKQMARFIIDSGCRSRGAAIGFSSGRRLPFIASARSTSQQPARGEKRWRNLCSRGCFFGSWGGVHVRSTVTFSFQFGLLRGGKKKPLISNKVNLKISINYTSPL